MGGRRIKGGRGLRVMTDMNRMTACGNGGLFLFLGCSTTICIENLYMTMCYHG